MKLFIHLSNDIEHFEVIEHSLRNLDGSVDIEHGDIVIMTSSLVTGYANLPDTDELKKISNDVHSFLSSINGAAKLKNLSFPKIVLKNILYKSLDKKKIDIPNFAEINCSIAIGNGHPPDISKIVKLSTENEAVSKALRLYNQELNWDNLSRIYEVIEETGFGFQGVTKRTKNAFGASANRSTISGDSARHGYITPNGEEPTTKMSQHEAQQFIRQVLNAWIESIGCGQLMLTTDEHGVIAVNVASSDINGLTAVICGVHPVNAYL